MSLIEVLITHRLPTVYLMDISLVYIRRIVFESSFLLPRSLSCCNEKPTLLETPIAGVCDVMQRLN